MKNEFAFLYPSPRALRFSGGFIDIHRLSFPLEICKKYDFLLNEFSIHGGSGGLEIVFHECSDFGTEEYAIECNDKRVVLGSASRRGQFYALATLLQVLAFHGRSGRMPAFTLRDSPEVALRGFMLSLAPGGIAPWADLQRLLLKLALLKFNCFALPAGAAGRDGLRQLTGLARRIGMEIMSFDRDPRAVFWFDFPGPGVRDLAEEPFFLPAERNGARVIADSWLEFFMEKYREGHARGKRIAVWSDAFALRPEWIRKLPADVLVLNRGAVSGQSAPFQAAALPFRRHHIRQALCPVLCARDRFVADARAGLARISAALTVARAWKLEGVMVAGGEEEGDLCLPAGAAMVRFQAGCLLWSGVSPGPPAFSLWAAGRDEPDLFRVYSFLTQAEHRLPYSHCRYLFEDPLTAPFSRQGDPREVLTHFRKAALYLKKRQVSPGELSGFLQFVGQLYEFIAAKLEFSSCFASLLDERDGPQKMVRVATWLGQESETIKNRYLGLRAESGEATGEAECLNSFAVLQQRFMDLARAGSRPGARNDLLAELKQDSSSGL